MSGNVSAANVKLELVRVGDVCDESLISVRFSPSQLVIEVNDRNDCPNAGF